MRSLSRAQLYQAGQNRVSGRAQRARGHHRRPHLLAPGDACATRSAVTGVLRIVLRARVCRPRKEALRSAAVRPGRGCAQPCCAQLQPWWSPTGATVECYPIQRTGLCMACARNKCLCHACRSRRGRCSAITGGLSGFKGQAHAPARRAVLGPHDALSTSQRSTSRWRLRGMRTEAAIMTHAFRRTCTPDPLKGDKQG